MLNLPCLVFVLALQLTAALTVTTDSSNSDNGAALAADGNTATFWHSQYSPTVAALPHWAIVDLGTSSFVNGFNYLPRQDGTLNGNIGEYTLEISTSGSSWITVASGTFVDDNSKKYIGFTATNTSEYKHIPQMIFTH